MYETRHGSHVVLEFAEPTASPLPSPGSLPSTPVPSRIYNQLARTKSCTDCSEGNASAKTGLQNGNASVNGNAKVQGGIQAVGTPTRLQATFEVIKKLGAGLASPSPRKGDTGIAKAGLGYFDVVDVDE